MNKAMIIFLLTEIVFANSSASENPSRLLKIVREPEPARCERGELQSFPKYNPDLANPFQVDLRSYDLSKLDLKSTQEDIFYANFNDRTIWPGPEYLPKGFNSKKIMELGKNPGLGINKLHERGITGRGVSIAILDQPMIINHQEYAGRIRLYEEINIEQNTLSQMHGPAVASIAVGKTVGVAPESELYYIALWSGDFDGGKFTLNYKYLAQGIYRILEINEQLAKDRKIRVISISVGWQRSQKGYKELTEAVQKAKLAGIFVLSTSLREVYGFKFNGLGRSPLADPDVFESYEPGLFWSRRFYKGIDNLGSDRLLIPMDSRTTASPCGPDEYVFYRAGGWSWSVPYIAGVYALAAQVEPTITPERFWALAMKTGRTIELDHGEKKIQFGPILDTAKLIDALEADELSDNIAVKAELKKYTSDGKLDPSGREFLSDINAKVARLDINSAVIDDVIRIFGEPLAYQLGLDFFEKDNLPDRYIVRYPGDFSIYMQDGCIEELRFYKPGYTFGNKLQVGSTMNDVFEVLGAPTEIVQGRPEEFKNGVLYKDIDGVEGYCYYSDAEQNVRIFLREYKIEALFLTRDERK